MWYIYCRRTTFFILSFYKIGCIRENIQVNLMLFRSFALSFHKIGCIRKNIQVNLMFFHSFALSLHYNVILRYYLDKE